MSEQFVTERQLVYLKLLFAKAGYPVEKHAVLQEAISDAYLTKDSASDFIYLLLDLLERPEKVRKSELIKILQEFENWKTMKKYTRDIDPRFYVSLAIEDDDE